MDFIIIIDITNYVIQKDKPRIMYNLYGVITHLREVDLIPTSLWYVKAISMEISIDIMMPKLA